MWNIFLREEGDCNAPLARPARSTDTVYVRHSRLRERETMEEVLGEWVGNTIQISDNLKVIT
jgi:hypothetical protein